MWSLKNTNDSSYLIILPVVGAMALTWFVRYIFFSKYAMLYHVIIIKTKVILPLGIGDLGRFGISCLGPLVFLLPKTFKLFGFQIFRL
jgi:hypothetical protein